MRIVCQKCSAAYAIDDKLLTPKGIRAQCPRCRHLQLVKNDAPAALPPSPAFAAVAAAPPLPPPPSAPPIGPPLAPKPVGVAPKDDMFFDFSALPTQATTSGGPSPAPAPALPAPPVAPQAASWMSPAAPAPPASLVVPVKPPASSTPWPAPPGPGDDLLDFSDIAVPPEPKTSPRSLAPLPAALARGGPTPAPSNPKPLAPVAPAPVPAPKSSAPFDFSADFSFGEPPPPPPPANGGREPSIATRPSRPAPNPAAAAPVVAPAAVKCKSCGKDLTDPFDQALGICDDCRSGAGNALSLDGSLGKPGAQMLGRLTPQPTPAVSAPDPSTATTEPTPELAAPKAKVKKLGRQVQSAYRDDDSAEGGAGKVVVIAVLAVAVIGGVGAFLYIKKPWVKPPPKLAQKLPITAARPIDAMVTQWKQSYGEGLTGSAAEHLAAGEEKLAPDTPRAYLEAEEEFKKALVLDKSNDRAIAGWALALAFGRGAKVDPETLKMAEAMLVAAEQRGGDARVYVAHAHLMLVRGSNLNDLKIQAERGLSSPSDKDKALGYLALSQAYLNQNTKLAEENLREAVKADPKLKRAYVAQVRLMVSMGDYRSAALTLEKRLESDPDQWEATDALAKLYIDMGDVPAAKRTYSRALQAAPDNPRVKLALGVIAYQHEGDLLAAADRLDALFAEKDKLEQGLKVELLGHRSALKRLLNDLGAATVAADEAIALKSDDVNARLQKLFVCLAQGNVADARAQVPFIKLDDAALETMVEARVLLAEEKPQDALAKLTRVIEADPRRVDGTILAGAAAVKAHQESKGWELVLAKALRSDPLQSGPRPAMAAYFTRAADFIAPARGLFAKLAKEKDDPNPRYAEGAMAWHAGDIAAADAAFGEVLSADPTNALAFSFRAMVAIKKRDYANAMKLATKAVGNDRTLGLAHYTLGSAQFLTGKVELARKTLREATERDPRLQCAKARLAEADIKVKKLAEAKAALLLILSADPSYSEAKRVLYGMPQ
jgi:predicted Zn finger-like uncharacterized protein